MQKHFWEKRKSRVTLAQARPPLNLGLSCPRLCYMHENMYPKRDRILII